MASIYWLLFTLAGALAQDTNLPPVAPGVFNVTARILIDHTNLTAAWDTLTNFPAYPKWNPFVRSSIAVDPANISLPVQRPIENTQLILRVQIPPLPLPVNQYTPDNPLSEAFSYENVTHVQPELYRLAWELYPNPLLKAERWQALSVSKETGRLLYESREVFNGPLAPLQQQIMQENLQASFNAQAQGLKLWLEGGH